MNKYSYSAPNEEIVKVLANYLSVSVTQINEYYEKLMGDDISADLEDVKFQDVKFHSEETEIIWNKSDYVALDLPIFYGGNGPEAETVVVLGLEPFHNSLVTKPMGISTPYALHNCEWREREGGTKIYYYFIKHIIDKGYNVYVSNIYKFLLNSNIKFEQPKFQEVLLKEIELVKAEIVITFGKLPSVICANDFQLGKRVLSMPNPSVSANRIWSTILKNKSNNFRPSIDTKLEWIKSKFDTSFLINK